MNGAVLDRRPGIMTIDESIGSCGERAQARCVAFDGGTDVARTPGDQCPGYASDAH